MPITKNSMSVEQLVFNDPDPHSFIDKGVKKVDTTIKKIKLNGKNVKLDESTTLNPFFTGVEGGTVLTLTPKEMYQNYKHVYVMCVKEDVKIDEDNLKIMANIFSKVVNKNDLIEACKKFTLIKTNCKLLKNYSLKKKANLVERNELDIYFRKEEENIFYELDEIVVPMYELNETKTKLYLKMFLGDSQFKEISDMIALAVHYNKYNSSTIIDSQIIDALTNVDASAYWKDPNHCNFNIDDIFESRFLSYNGFHLGQIRYATLCGARTLNNLLTDLSGNDKQFQKKKTDYHLETSIDADSKAEHVNVYQALLNSDNRTFYATVDDGQFGFTKSDVAEIFDRISDEKYRFNLLNSMLVSKDLCHFVYNNKRVLKRNADLFEKYPHLYMNLIGYPASTFYLEESIFTTRTNKNHRYVFDIDTAYELPQFPFSMENIHHNPYATILLNRDIIDPSTNCMSINSLEDYKKYYGVCTRQEGLRRFNVFASGREDVNIFEGIDPKIFSFSGSFIPACLQRRSPLIDICTTEDMNFNDTFTTFFAHYYDGADIDVMCGTSTMVDFLIQSTTFLSTLCKNTGIRREELMIDPHKKAAVVITNHFYKECVKDLNEETSSNYTSEQLKNVFNACASEDENKSVFPQEIMNYFYADYVQEKNVIVKKWRALQQAKNIEIDTGLLASYNSITSIEDLSIKMVTYDLTSDTIRKRDSEMYYFVNDFRDEDSKVDTDKNFLVFKFSESIKYKMSSQKLKRDIEIFKVDPIDPFNTVARFHKPCVRAYLQGDNFYMLPSFITAMMTMINIDYKYFAGSRDPVDIINKYLMRGYSVILNTNEKKSMLMYNKNVDGHKGMFTVDDESTYFGPKDLNHKYYKPGTYKLGLPEDIYRVSRHRYINTVDELREHYENKGVKLSDLPFDVMNYTAIGPSGSITPLQMWIVQAIYETVNKQ